MCCSGLPIKSPLASLPIGTEQSPLQGMISINAAEPVPASAARENYE
jgi:hypothetical protein